MTRVNFPGQFALIIWFAGARPVACLIPSRFVPGRMVAVIATPTLCRVYGGLPLPVAIEKVEAALAEALPA